MPIKTTAYKCSFGCRKIYKGHSTMKRHERTCFNNPERRACQTCGHWLKNGDIPKQDWIDYVECDVFEGMDYIHENGMQFKCPYWKAIKTSEASE
jgi:hypothetical protein